MKCTLIMTVSGLAADFSRLIKGCCPVLAVVGNKWGGSYSKQARAQWLTIGKRRCGLVRANSLFSLSICCHSRQRRSIKQIFGRAQGDSYQIFDHGAPAQILGHCSQTARGVSRTHSQPTWQKQQCLITRRRLQTKYSINAAEHEFELI